MNLRYINPFNSKVYHPITPEIKLSSKVEKIQKPNVSHKSVSQNITDVMKDIPTTMLQVLQEAIKEETYGQKGGTRNTKFNCFYDNNKSRYIFGFYRIEQ